MHLTVYYRSDPLFFDRSGTLPRQPVFGKVGKICLIRRSGIPKRIGLSQRRWVH